MLSALSFVIGILAVLPIGVSYQLQTDQVIMASQSLIQLWKRLKDKEPIRNIQKNSIHRIKSHFGNARNYTAYMFCEAKVLSLFICSLCTNKQH